MKLALVLVAYLIAMVSGGCTEDEVNSTYEISADQLQVSTNVENGAELLRAYLYEKEYLGDISVSGKSRAENDKDAVVIYDERVKKICKLDLKKELALKEGEELSATFVYALKRSEDVLKETPVEIH